MGHYFYRILLVAILVASCQDNTKTNEITGSFLGGEIVNPNQDFLTLEREGELIDTIFLDKRNRFKYVFKDNDLGLFTIRHQPESQILFVEENDSILLRLNTLEFDESLMYSGKGAEKNNLLMEMFLQNEQNNDLILSYYKISPQEFLKKTDSIHQERLAKLNTLNEVHEFSDAFLNIAKKGIDYEYYDLRERYAFLINKYFTEFRKKIPQDFFDYRKQVNFNDEDLTSHYIYQRFLDNYLKNRSLEYCITHNLGRPCFSLSNVENLERRLKLADSLFKNDNLRKHFIKKFAKNQIIFSENDKQISGTLSLVETLGFSDDLINQLKALGKVHRSFFIGENIKDKELVTPKNQNKSYQEIVKRNSIIFYWSVYSSNHHKELHHRINELRNKYPEIDFIGVNIDATEPKIWKKTLSNFDYNQDFEYQIKELKCDKSLYNNYLNKILFVNKKGEIVRGDIQINDPDFENYVLEFLNL